MSNYSADQLGQLRNQVVRFHELVLESQDWVNSNLKFEERDQALHQVKHSRRLTRRILSSIATKPVFALFGASQVGKSYLVKNLLSVGGKPLLIQLGEQGEVDFLREINPPGVGAESTGVVTRFTADQVGRDAKFPVQVKLLKPADLVLILCDSFFSDISKIENYPDAAAFRLHLDSLEKEFGTSSEVQNHLTEDDVLNFQEYFARNFLRFSHLVEAINSSRFFERVGRLIGAVPAKDWVKVFSPIWCSSVSISSYFGELVAQLKELDYAEVLFLPPSAILREGGALLDVQRLKEIGSNRTRMEAVRADGKIYSAELAYLSALSAEVTLSVTPQMAEQKPFLHHTDLLDFPGARSRLGLSQNTIESVHLPGMFLRGKIAYLFNKYSADFEINNLLFCQNDNQSEVTELPYLLHDWISNNIGKTAADRQATLKDVGISPLFLVFTFFNNQLAFDSTNDNKGDGDFDYKWNTRFHRFFEEELVTKSFNWHTGWTVDQPDFSNFYLLRDYKYSQDTFMGFDDIGLEKGIQENRRQFLDDLRQSFLKHAFVRRHFTDPVKAWDAAALPNADGSQLIVDSLGPAANNGFKVRNIVRLLTASRKNLFSHLNKHLHSDNLHELRVSSLRRCNEIQLEFNRLFESDPGFFDRFLRSQVLSETQVYNYILQNLNTSGTEELFDRYAMFRMEYPGVSASHSREENIRVLKEYLFLDTEQEVGDWLLQHGIELDKLLATQAVTGTHALVDGLLEMAFGQWAMNGAGSQNQVIGKSTLGELHRILSKSVDQMDFRGMLVELVDRKLNSLRTNREEAEHLAGACTFLINEFFTGFGFNFMAPERLAELAGIATEYRLDLSPLTRPVEKPGVQVLLGLFERLAQPTASFARLTALGRVQTYVLRLKLASLSNCGFVDYDVKANDKLAKWTSHVNDLDFIVGDQVI